MRFLRRNSKTTDSGTIWIEIVVSSLPTIGLSAPHASWKSAEVTAIAVEASPDADLTAWHEYCHKNEPSCSNFTLKYPTQVNNMFMITYQFVLQQWVWSLKQNMPANHRWNRHRIWSAVRNGLVYLFILFTNARQALWRHNRVCQQRRVAWCVAKAFKCGPPRIHKIMDLVKLILISETARSLKTYLNKVRNYGYLS